MSYEANLIVNGNAEAGPNSPTGAPVSVPGWTTSSAFTVIPYGAPSALFATDPGPGDRANQFFAGGNAASGSAAQDIDVSANSGDINAGIVSYDVSGWFGGFLTEADDARLTITFFNNASNVLGAVTIGPVSNLARNNITGLFFRRGQGGIPTGTSRIHLNLTMRRATGASDDGYADSLSLVLRKSPPTVNFTGASWAETTNSPPDAMGAVGPAQYLVAIEGKIRTFNKVTGLADGALDISPNVFFASVETLPGAGEIVVAAYPRVRYDRFSQRWFLTAIDVRLSSSGDVVAPNRILIAVSAGPVITNNASFQFFYFQQDQAPPAGDPTGFADAPSLGIDINALYIGANMFNNGLSLSGASAFVIRKASLLGGGPIMVTAFRELMPGGTSEGPFAPQGVDNFDDDAREGYFIGVSPLTFGTLVLRRISDPGGTPRISENIIVTVPQGRYPITVPHLGNTGGTSGKLDPGDDRLTMAQIRNSRLWTVHTIGVNNTGGNSSNPTRNAARWYEFKALDETPTLVQSGTVFSSSPANDSAQKHFFYSSIMVSGQGHAAIGFSTAGSSNRINAGFTSRRTGDAAGTMDPPSDYTDSMTAYNPSFDPGFATGRRWGNYSYTSLDPEDDMTMWTIQEFCDATNSFGVRAVKLFAPPPATPLTATPASVPAGAGNVSVVINGVSLAGSGFFDPGPGFTKRLGAIVSGGILVNSVIYNSPTSATLNLNTTGAFPCAQDVTIINPDGQNLTGASILSVVARPILHVAYQLGNQLQLSWNYPVECAATVMFRIEQSQDLQTWTQVNGTIANPTPGNFETLVAASPGNNQFCRLIVTGL